MKEIGYMPLYLSSKIDPGHLIVENYIYFFLFKRKKVHCEEEGERGNLMSASVLEDQFRESRGSGN